MEINIVKYLLNKRFFAYAIIAYVALYAIMAIARPALLPTAGHLAVQAITLLLLFVFSYLYSNKSIWITILLIFLFQLGAGALNRYLFIATYANPLGGITADSQFYHDMGTKTYSMPITVFLDFLSKFDLDDRGMHISIYAIYRLCGGPDVGVNVYIIINAICVAISSYFIHGAASRIVDAKSAMFITFFWGCEVFASYTAASGLKENIMALFVTISLYYIVELSFTQSPKALLLAILSALFLLLFRLAVFYFLLCAIIYALFARVPLVKKYHSLIIVIMVIIISLYSYEMIDEVAQQRGYSYDTLEGFTESKAEDIGPLSYISTYIGSVIGPFPKMVDNTDKLMYITLYSFGCFCKVLLSFFLIYGVFIIFKKKTYSLMPLLLFLLMHMFMLIFTMFALHERYQWPQRPAVLLLSAYGCAEWYSNKHILNWSIYYQWVAIALIFFVNLRQ